MVFFFLYVSFRALLGALVRSRRGLDLKDIELLVLWITTTARGRIAPSNSSRPNSTSDGRDRLRAKSAVATASVASSTSTTEPPETRHE